MISIIIPCYNQGHFLDETLQSVLNQTDTNWECIVVNDGSSNDNTEEIAKNWCVKDSRFKYLKKLNGGRSSARNIGLDNAKGDYIQFLDADDLLESTKFEKSIAMFEKEHSDVVITNFLRFRENLQKTKRAFCKLQEQEYSFDSILLGWDILFSIPIHCGIFKKSVIDTVRFSEELNAHEDWFFWLNVYRNVKKTSFINENLAFYRMNPNGTTVNHNHMAENKKKAYSLIYDSLDDHYKKILFERLVNELGQSKLKFHNFKYNLFYRKMFYNVKGIFLKKP